METLEIEAPHKTRVAKKASAPVLTIAPISRDFYWDRNRHATGWHPTTLPQFDPGTAFHVAHDTLEHLDQTDASLEAEMRAFGAHLYLRSTTDYWTLKDAWIKEDTVDPLERMFGILRHKESPAMHMVGDLFSFLDADKRILISPGEPEPLPEDAEQAIAEVERLGRRQASNHGLDLHHSNRNSAKQEWDERIRNAQDWMRIGYRDHAERFAGLSGHDRAAMFIAVEKAVGDLTAPLSNYSNLTYGDKLKVTVNFFPKREIELTIEGKRIPHGARKQLIVPF